MIVATLAGEKYLLASLQDAEALLQILDRAKRVDTSYLETPHFHEVVHHTAFGGREVSISVISGTVMDFEAFDTAKQAESAGKAARRASEGAPAVQ
jgi:hypothetical protein